MGLWRRQLRGQFTYFRIEAMSESRRETGDLSSPEPGNAPAIGADDEPGNTAPSICCGEIRRPIQWVKEPTPWILINPSKLSRPGSETKAVRGNDRFDSQKKRSSRCRHLPGAGIIDERESVESVDLGPQLYDRARERPADICCKKLTI
jgi:hypothetical protein